MRTARQEREGGLLEQMRDVSVPVRSTILMVVATAAAVLALGGPWRNDSPSVPARSLADDRFLDTDNGTPLTWSRCRPIRWVFNAGGVDKQIVLIVHGAVDHVAAASGFEFDFVDYTDGVADTATDVREQFGADLIIEIVPDDATDLLSGREWGRTDVRPQDGRIIDAVVAISAAAEHRLPVGFDVSSWGALVLHELGHVLGLAESPNPDDLMFPILEESAGRLSDDDLAGLKQLADAGAC